MFLGYVAVIVCVWICRRYRSERYFTQKYSRRCDYVKKAKLSALRVPWSVAYPEYKPLGTIGTGSFWWFNLSYIDGHARFLVEVSPYIFCSVPFNPLGRTGAVGKGVFPHTGVNSIILTIVWSRSLGFLKMLAFQKGTLMYRGYLDHPMNTDNAWVEASIYKFEVQDYSGVTEKCPEWLEMFVKELSC